MMGHEFPRSLASDRLADDIHSIGIDRKLLLQLVDDVENEVQFIPASVALRNEYKRRVVRDILRLCPQMRTRNLVGPDLSKVVGARASCTVWAGRSKGIRRAT